MSQALQQQKRAARVRPGVISDLAFAKLVAHAVQHPQSAVCGLLLGGAEKRRNAQEQEEKQEGEFSDAVALFHNAPQAAMTEAVLELVQLYCEERELEIKGLYLANSRIGDNSVPKFLGSLASKIRARYADARVLVLDNGQVGANWSLLVHESRNAGAWVPAPELPILEPSERAKAAFGKGVADFDDHLENVAKDFFNLDFSL